MQFVRGIKFALILTGGIFFSSAVFATKNELPASLQKEIEENDILKLQIGLDRINFSTGCIDGSWGRKTAVAFETWKALQPTNILATGEITVERAIKESLIALPEDLFVSFTVTTNDASDLVTIPFAPSERAKLKHMGYSTLLEKFAEKGHCTEGALKRWNRHVDWPNPKPGTKIYIPNVVIPKFHTGQIASLRVCLSRREITVFDVEGKFFALFPCSIAASKNHLPKAGELYVTTLVKNPNYSYKSPKYANSEQEGYLYSPGPNSPVGDYWIGLTLPTYGIHGTPNPETIGRAESHGCFRLTNWDVEKLFQMLDAGTPVVIED